MSWLKLHQRAVELALERGQINYVEYAEIVNVHPSYASQILAEAAKLDERVTYYRGVLYSKEAYREKILSELTRRLSR